MYEYLRNLDEGCANAVVNTEGRICVLGADKAVKEEVVLRHYAFLLDYMSVPMEKVLLVCMNGLIVRKLKNKFHRRYKDIHCQIMDLEEVDDTSQYDYVLIYDAHNVDVFSASRLKSLCSNARNLYLFLSCSDIKSYHNIDLVDLMQSNSFDMEICTDESYSIAEYILDVDSELQKLKRIREEEERRERERAKREAERKAEIERKKAEEEARRKAEELRKRQNSPFYIALKPYIDWYVQNWYFFESMEKDKWNAVGFFSKTFDINATDFAANLENAFDLYRKNFIYDISFAHEALVMFARISPDDVRLVLKNLFNENDSLKLKMVLYRSQINRIATLIRGRSSYDVNTVELERVGTAATYLALAFPDKYYFYDMHALSKFCEKTNLSKPGTVLESKYEAIEEFYDKIRMALTARPILLTLCDETSERNFINSHLLTCSFISSIVRYFVDFDIQPDTNSLYNYNSIYES